MLYNIYTTYRACADATAVELKLPAGSKEHFFRFASSVAWEWAHTEAGLAHSIPMSSGDTLTIDGPVAGGSIWVRQSSGGPVEIRWAFLQPKIT